MSNGSKPRRQTGGAPKLTQQAVQQAMSTNTFAPNPPADEKQNLEALIQELEKARGTRVIVYWTTDMAQISESVVVPLYDQLTSIGKTPRLDLFLRTNGGQTETPWRIVSLVREFCDEFNVLVPHRAASSGTLTALGADSIVMTPLGVLGPIDPSRTHSLLPRREGATEAEPVSVQDMRHAMQFIREAAGGGKGSSAGDGGNDMPYTPDAMAQIFTALFDKIHPLAIGAIEQSYALSKLVGTQCLGTHMDPVTQKDEIQAIVDKLCDDYKSHQYQICREEGRRAGLKVKDASPEVEEAMMNLFRFYSARQFMPTTQPSAGKQFQAHIAWLDSMNLNLRAEGQYVAKNANEISAVGDAWIAY